MSSVYQTKTRAMHPITEEIRKVREAVWGNEVYRECGSTAVIRIDGFHDDAAGWEAYYAGRGEIPMDAVGIRFEEQAEAPAA